jgi:hypothetical protein
MKKFFVKNYSIIIISTFVVVLLGVGVWKYRELSLQLRELKTNPSKLQEFAQDDQKALVGVVGKLMELPVDEVPTVAQVSDAEKLKEQPFFAGAQNGDRVLIYTNARKAILYRPTTNKIIDVAPINIGTGSAAAVTTPTNAPTKFPTPTVK